MVKGDKGPIYGATFDDDGRGGYASILPFNAYGALGMAREEYDPDSASSQFFWLLFDSDLTPAGEPTCLTPPVNRCFLLGGSSLPPTLRLQWLLPARCLPGRAISTRSAFGVARLVSGRAHKALFSRNIVPLTKASTVAGKNLLDGRYACFGYTVDGARLLADVKEGDIITSAKVPRVHRSSRKHA